MKIQLLIFTGFFFKKRPLPSTALGQMTVSVLHVRSVSSFSALICGHICPKSTAAANTLWCKEIDLQGTLCFGLTVAVLQVCRASGHLLPAGNARGTGTDFFHSFILRVFSEVSHFG